MQTNRDYTIRGSEKDGDGYFVVSWCPFALADKYDIAKRVPALGGIAEIYYKDGHGKLNLFCLQNSWYGGVRSMLRERCDPELERDAFRLPILERWKDAIYYRYSLSDSSADMQDVMYFLIETMAPGSDTVEHSGRYNRIFVRELDAGKLVTT